jgi:hypothetical protein
MTYMKPHSNTRVFHQYKKDFIDKEFIMDFIQSFKLDKLTNYKMSELPPKENEEYEQKVIFKNYTNY